MARARNIKPAFFKNELLAELEPFDRLLFIGLWCLADREGRAEDRPKRIKMELFPCDTYDVDAGLNDLAAHGFIRRYHAAGQSVLLIVNFTKHQTPHGTEKDSDLPDENGVITVRERDLNGYVSGKRRKNNVNLDESNVVVTVDAAAPDVKALGENALNPEPRILIPESLTNTGAGKPAHVSHGEKTLKTALAECAVAGRKVVPDDHPVRAYCAAVGITAEMAGVAWMRFREEHTTGTRKDKLYADWAAAFANSVKDRWYKLWITSTEGDATWTNEGMQARRAIDAQLAAAEAAAHAAAAQVEGVAA